MKRTLLSILMIFAPLTVLADGPGSPPPPGDATRPPSAVERDGTTQVKPASSADTQQPTRPQPPPVPNGRRRRGSMVGYIDDAIIESKVLIRFDVGFQNTVPDRAEFFYGKCGCWVDAGADPEAPGPRPGAASDLDFQQLYVSGEYAVNERFSAFVHVPLRWIQPQAFIERTFAGSTFSDQGGFGDLRAGAKVGLIASEDRSVTAQARIHFPTGEASKGLGTDHASLEPALLYYQRVSEVVALESQVGVWLPFGGSSAAPGVGDGDFSGNVFFFGIGPSFEIYRGDRVQFAPVVELVGWRVMGGFQTLPGDPAPGDPASALEAEGTNIVNLKFGGRFSFDRGSIYVGYGHALTDASWYDDIVRVEYRYTF